MARVVLGIVGALVGAALVAAALLLYDARTAPPIIIEDPRPNATIVVAIDGAVATPGVYTLRGDARVQDALDAAGGTDADADLSGINLAQRLRDEARVVIPRRAAPAAVHAAVPTVPKPGASRAGSATKSQPATREPVNINTATAHELDALPRIGPAIAQRIIDYRQEHGPFRTVEELANVKGISAAMVDELRPLITVGP